MMSWTELNTSHPETAREFYGRMLGWNFEELKLPDGSNYWLAKSGDAPVCGIHHLTSPRYDGVPDHWMTYLAVPDIDTAVSETRRQDCDVSYGPMAVPGVGRIAVIVDAAGALVGLIEPEQHQGATIN
jgi:uncharacterized protein